MPTVPQGPTAGNRLVIFAPNWLGDAVMALPAIADIRRANPQAILHVAARRSIAPLFTLVDGIDDVFDVAGIDVRGRSFDAALLLPNSFQSAFTAWRAGIRERWGYRTQGRSPLLTRSVAIGPRGHQAAYYQHLTTALGYPPGGLRPALRASADMRDAGERLLRGGGWDGHKPVVAFAPGAANGRAKQWPAEFFAGVARALAEDGVMTAIVGAPGDAPAAAEVLKRFAMANAAAPPVPPPIDLVGRTDLPTLAGVLTHARALVTNDSGGMHFAAALGIPVTAMFGPSNEQETRPLGEGQIDVLTHPVWCRPCMLRECPIGHRCMRGISVDAVLQSTRGALRSASAS
jgi:heptosyltransferase-2